MCTTHSSLPINYITNLLREVLVLWTSSFTNHSRVFGHGSLRQTQLCRIETPTVRNHYISTAAPRVVIINKYASDVHKSFGFERSFVDARLNLTPFCICDNSAPCGPFPVGVTSLELDNVGDMSLFLLSGCFFAVVNLRLRQFMRLAWATLTRPIGGRVTIVSLMLLHIRSAISSAGGGGSGRSSQSSWSSSTPKWQLTSLIVRRCWVAVTTTFSGIEPWARRCPAAPEHMPVMDEFRRTGGAGRGAFTVLLRRMVATPDWATGEPAIRRRFIISRQMFLDALVNAQ